MGHMKRLKFVILKTIRMISLVVCVSIVSFALMVNSPIDPVKAYIGADMMGVSAEQEALIRERWGLDDPPAVQYVKWATSVLKGDLGTSMIYRKPVLEVIGERFIASLALMCVAWVLSGVIGFALGLLAACKQNSLTDKLIRGYCLVLSSTPTFWLGLLSIIVFSVNLGIFPLGLGVPAGTLAAEVSLFERLHHLILPALTLALLGVSNVAFHTREKMIEVLNSDYILFAKARGERGLMLVVRHGIRNTILPALTLQFASFSELFGGAVLMEQIFSYPGLGQITVQSGLRGDIPLLLGIVIFSALFVFMGNMIADLLINVVDPRIKEGEPT